MSSLAMVRLQLRALELKLGVKKGGFGFWLFVFNCLASLFLLAWFAFFVNWIVGIISGIFVFAVIRKVNVTNFWNGLVK